MFLRANVRRAGLTYQGLRGEANYAGAFRDDRVVGVAAHCWTGMLLLQAPEHAAELGTRCPGMERTSGHGPVGTAEEVRQARSELELDSADVALDGAEWLNAHDLSQLVVPEPLSNGTVVCRPPRPEERDALCACRPATISSFWGQPILRAPGDAPRSFSTRRLLKEMRGSPLWKTRLFPCRISTPHSRILFSSGLSTPRSATGAWFRQSGCRGIAPRGA